MKLIRVIIVLRRILTDSDIIDLYGLYCEFYKFEQMREVRKELNQFVKPVQIEIIMSRKPRTMK